MEDIQEVKEKNLKDNILSLEKFSKDIDKMIIELKNIFEKISKDKEELKLNVQKIFTKIRNTINEREDEILLIIDEKYNNTYIYEDIIKEIDRYPNKINKSLNKAKDTIDKWKNGNNEKKINLSFLINNCIEIENDFIKFNNFEKNFEKCKKQMPTIIKFFPLEDNDDLSEFISDIKKFGNVFTENKNKDIINNSRDKQIFNVDIQTINEEPKGLCIKLNSFSKDINNIYYNNINLDEKDMILTFHLYIQNDIINKIIENEEKYKISINKEFFLFDYYSIRKEENKLFLDLKFKYIGLIGAIDFLYEYLIKQIDISFYFKNNFSFEQYETMEFDEFFKLFTSFNLSIKGSFNNFKKLLLDIQKNNDMASGDKQFLAIVYKILIILIMAKLKLKLKNKNEIISEIFELTDEDKKFKNELNRGFIAIKEIIQKFLKQIKNIFGEEICNKINYNKILITFLYAKFELGLSLEICSTGFNNYLKNI